MESKKVPIQKIKQKGVQRPRSPKHNSQHPYQNDDPAHPYISDELEVKLQQGHAVYEDA